MKLFTVLALLSVAALATAAPCGHEGNGHQGGGNSNQEDNSITNNQDQSINTNQEDHSINSNQEDHSVNTKKEAHQTMGNVGSTTDNASGLLPNLLKLNVLSPSTVNNNPIQNNEVN